VHFYGINDSVLVSLCARLVLPNIAWNHFPHGKERKTVSCARRDHETTDEGMRRERARSGHRLCHVGVFREGDQRANPHSGVYWNYSHYAVKNAAKREIDSEFDSACRPVQTIFHTGGTIECVIISRRGRLCQHTPQSSGTKGILVVHGHPTHQEHLRVLWFQGLYQITA
jgi:hypothetical protein